MSRLYTIDWQIEEVSAVIFDKDGTIIDSHIYWGEIIKRRAGALISELGLDIALRVGLEKAMGYDADACRLLPEGPIALKSRAEVISCVERFINKSGARVEKEKISDIFTAVHDKFSSEVPLFTHILPGVRELLIELKNSGIPCALVTADGLKNTEEILKHLGVTDCFKAVLGRESCPGAKENGEPAKVAALKLGAHLEKTVCIGDTSADMEMAKNAGLKAFIGVATGQVPMPILTGLTPYTVSNLTFVKVGK